MHTCNENQIDTLFILSLSRQLPLHVSGIFVAHHQEEYYIYIYSKYKLLYVYSLPPDAGAQICPKHIEVV